MNEMLLNYEQMAELFSVNENTVRNWVSNKKIPSEAIFKLPGKRSSIRFIRSKIEKWINGAA